MKFFILSIPLILLTIQVFWSCNCQIVSINGVPSFSLSGSTLQIFRSADSANSKAFQAIFSFGTNAYSSTTANLPSVNASDLAKTVITNSVQNDLTKILYALNAVATSLTGCIPQTSYPNDFNISTSCFSLSCTSTGFQCQALYTQLAIDELTIAMNTAVSNLNLTSSILVGSNVDVPSLSSITTQWLIVQASAAAYQTSTSSGPLINTVNSSFKKVLSAALSGTNLFLNKFTTEYKTLISAVNNTNYNQSFSDYAHLVMLSASTNATKSLLTGTSMFNGIKLTASPVQSSISGISISSFVRPATNKVFDSLSGLTTVINTELQQNFTNSVVNVTSQIYNCSIDAVKSSYSDSVWKTDLSSIVQYSQTETSNLLTNYANLVSSYTNMAINCFKVGCADNTIYPYSLWKLQCVNDFSFTSFCLNGGFPSTLQRCPSAKAQALISCLNNVTSLIESIQPATDMSTILGTKFQSYVYTPNEHHPFLIYFDVDDIVIFTSKVVYKTIVFIQHLLSRVSAASKKMKFFILSTALILLTIQAFWSCNCQIVPVSINELPNFNLSSSTLKILKSSSYGFTSSMGGGIVQAPITAVTVSLTASNLAKNLITNSLQSDVANIMGALNAIATSLAGCKPEISYANDFNISTSCFTLSCTSTGIQCQALYVQLAIDELVTAINTAEYHLNLTSSLLVGSASTIPSVSTITTQWLIVQASAAAYQTSTSSGPLINTVNSSFKKVLGAALNATNLFLNKYSSGYMSLVSSVNIANYNQSVDDFANSIILSAVNRVAKNLYGPLFNRTKINDFRVGSSVNGISVSNFIQPATSAVFNSLSSLTSTFNTELDNLQNNMQSLIAEQQKNITDLIVNTAQTLQAQYKDAQTYSDVSKCVATTLTQSFVPNWMLKPDLSSIIQSAQTETSNLTTNYTNLISSFTNMATNCFKVGCAGNTIYPYSLWKFQCVNDFSFTNFCLSGGFPGTFQRCPSAKAQALIACLNNVTSLITSLQPATDMNMIVENTRSSFDALMENYSNDTIVLTSFNSRNTVAANCYYSRIYSSA